MKKRTIEIDISLRYLDLITIFFKANGLTDLGFVLTTADVKYCLLYTSDAADE